MAKKARTLPVARRPVSEARQRVFLEHLARTGVVAEASRLASPHAVNFKGASGSFYSLRRIDPHFAVAWDAAQERADAALLTEARRRAVEGCERGIFQKGTQATTADGEPATERVYSDRLLELLLKSRFPTDFVERRQVEHVQGAEGWQITGQDLHALTDEQTEQLQEIMAAVMLARGETEREDVALIDVTPSPEVIEVEVIEVEDPEPIEAGDTLAELEALEVAG